MNTHQWYTPIKLKNQKLGQVYLFVSIHTKVVTYISTCVCAVDFSIHFFTGRFCSNMHYNSRRLWIHLVYHCIQLPLWLEKTRQLQILFRSTSQFLYKKTFGNKSLQYRASAVFINWRNNRWMTYIVDILNVKKWFQLHPFHLIIVNVCGFLKNVSHFINHFYPRHLSVSYSIPAFSLFSFFCLGIIILYLEISFTCVRFI